MEYLPYQTFNYGGAGSTLSGLRNMPIDQLLALRTNARIAQGAPALAEQARQFDVGTGETARQFDVSNLYRNRALMSEEQRALQALQENARQYDIGAAYQNRALTSEEQRALQALKENARQFDIGNLGTNERYYSGLGENARQFDIGNVGTNQRYYAGLGEQARATDLANQYNYAKLANDQLLAQLDAWSRMIAGMS